MASVRAFENADECYTTLPTTGDLSSFDGFYAPF
jgi:hypothetical protein